MKFPSLVPRSIRRYILNINFSRACGGLLFLVSPCGYSGSHLLSYCLTTIRQTFAKLAHADICLHTLGSYFYHTRLVGSADAYERTVLRLETVFDPKMDSSGYNINRGYIKYYLGHVVVFSF